MKLNWKQTLIALALVCCTIIGIIEYNSILMYFSPSSFVDAQVYYKYSRDYDCDTDESHPIVLVVQNKSNKPIAYTNIGISARQPGHSSNVLWATGYDTYHDDTIIAPYSTFQRCLPTVKGTSASYGYRIDYAEFRF